VINYTTEDFTTDSATYDVIVDCVGNAGDASAAAATVVADSPSKLGWLPHFVDTTIWSRFFRCRIQSPRTASDAPSE